ncbi:hypothetical protein Xen7305DRAFT_00024910 [Xenococcus sp. PCC 7305]|uniref:hypothetical protein n=1 Tax=Xenococcus sp. PCC 7305 TaxID=102125 RepID=UPI0002ABD45A|nr:hypothetical protein [Xenococcus sp. PCC 7305]ELS02773.1 hypothetical protein Xen7305DRAFT_00024910 [Xenococcus sp. PCC 7305]
MTKSLFTFTLGIGYLILATFASLAETSSAVTQEYPEEYSQNYHQECKATAIAEGLPDIEAETLCNCTLREFQQKYTIDEFKDLNKRSETDTAASDALIEVGELCFEEILFE